jgi:hypothetical protein
MVVMGLLMGAPETACAANSVWTSAVNGSWDDASKWDIGIPLAGTNALLNVSGSYTVDYTNPVNYMIGGIVVVNTSGNSTTLNINTNGFRFTGGTISNATVTVNGGGVVTNTGNFGNLLSTTATSPNSALVINGGSYVQTGGTFGNSGSGLVLQVNDGIFDITSGGGNFYPVLVLKGGLVRIWGSTYNTIYSSTISGGVYSNLSSQAFGIRSGTVVVTNQGSVVSTGFFITGNGETLRLDGGSMEIMGYRLEIGNHAFTGSRSGYIYQTGGVVNMTNTVGLVVGKATGAMTGGTYLYDFQGGTLNLEKITLTAATRQGAVGTIDRFKMSGGTLNLGSGGLVYGGGTGTQSVQLSGGVVGAQNHWSSSLDMSLLSGTTTFRASDTNSVAYNITLSGVLSGNGALSKTGGGTLLLNGTNTYTGATAINSGTLGGTGSIAGTTTVASNAFVSGGSTIAVGTLSVTNLVLQEGAGLAWNYGTATQDRVVVTSALTLPTNCVVNVSAVEGAIVSQLPASAVLMTYTSSSGATSLDGWAVNGLPITARVRLDVPNKRVLMITNKGTLISIM